MPVGAELVGAALVVVEFLPCALVSRGCLHPTRRGSYGFLELQVLFEAL